MKLATVLFSILVNLSIGAGQALPVRPTGLEGSSCPVDNPKARDNVVRFLSSPNFADVRANHWMVGVGAERVRVLNNTNDAAACQQLRSIIQLGTGRYPRIATYYYADGYYFVPTTWVVPSDRMYLAHAPLLVFDSNLNLLGSYAL